MRCGSRKPSHRRMLQLVDDADINGKTDVALPRVAISPQVYRLHISSVVRQTAIESITTTSVSRDCSCPKRRQQKGTRETISVESRYSDESANGNDAAKSPRERTRETASRDSDEIFAVSTATVEMTSRATAHLFRRSACDSFGPFPLRMQRVALTLSCHLETPPRAIANGAYGETSIPRVVGVV